MNQIYVVGCRALALSIKGSDLCCWAGALGLSVRGSRFGVFTKQVPLHNSRVWLVCRNCPPESSVKQEPMTNQQRETSCLQPARCKPLNV